MLRVEFDKLARKIAIRFSGACLLLGAVTTSPACASSAYCGSTPLKVKQLRSTAVYPNSGVFIKIVFAMSIDSDDVDLSKIADFQSNRSLAVLRNDTAYELVLDQQHKYALPVAKKLCGRFAAPLVSDEHQAPSRSIRSNYYLVIKKYSKSNSLIVGLTNGTEFKPMFTSKLPISYLRVFGGIDSPISTIDLITKGKVGEPLIWRRLLWSQSAHQ